MKIVIISDTHLHENELGMLDGDLLIHCGDFYSFGFEDPKLDRLNNWFRHQRNFKNKLFVPGSHDSPVYDQKFRAESLLYEASLLVDRLVEIEGLRIYGSPWSPGFENWAYGAPRYCTEFWSEIPANLDLLATHFPPLEILDYKNSESTGCEWLRKKVFEVKPNVHCFGHSHKAFGCTTRNGIQFLNACQSNGPNFRNCPVTLEL